jgi:hypothetical protein
MDQQKVDLRASSGTGFPDTLGQPVREILCSKKGGVRVRVRPRHLVRALGPRILVRNILSRPNHPPFAPTLDLGTVSPPELERAAGTTLDSTQADDAHAASSASMCAHLMIRQAIRERAAVGRLGLRLRHRSCATTSSFEARLHETPGHHFGDSRCASRRSRERTMACFFTSRLRISPIPYPLRNQDVHADCTLCRLLACVAPPFMSM